jgi:hypothetical protein
MGGMDFASFYDFSIGFWNCGDIVCFSFYYNGRYYKNRYNLEQTRHCMKLIVLQSR